MLLFIWLVNRQCQPPLDTTNLCLYILKVYNGFDFKTKAKINNTCTVDRSVPCDNTDLNLWSRKVAGLALSSERNLMYHKSKLKNEL